MHRRETIKGKEKRSYRSGREKKKKKKRRSGRQVLLAVFLLFAQAIFQRSLYLYTTTTSQSVVKHLLHVAVGAVVSHHRFTPGRRRHLMDLRAAKDTTTTVLSLSRSLSVPNIVHSRALFLMCEKGVSIPRFTSLSVAGCQEGPQPPAPPASQTCT